MSVQLRRNPQHGLLTPWRELIPGVQIVESAFISVIVEPSHRRDFRDCTVSLSPTNVNQEIYGAGAVRHNRSVWQFDPALQDAIRRQFPR